MRSHKTGKICDGLYYLGRKETGVYWLEGNGSAIIISGGMSYIAPDVVEQIKEFQLDEDKLKGLLILHAHFDHVGIIPFLTRKYPQMTVYGSERAWEILVSPKAVETVNQFSRLVAEQNGNLDVLSRYDVDWPLGLTGETVGEGGRISLGDRDIQVLSTPGHSSCSVTAYADWIKAVFPSDGGGIPFEDIIVSAGNSNFTQYQASLERLAGLDVHYVCADHFGYVYGEEAAGYMARSVAQAKSDRVELEDCFRREGDVDRAAKLYTETFFGEHPDYFLSPEIYVGVCRQIMRHIAKCLEG